MFINGAARKSFISLLDPIQNQGLRLSFEALRTFPVQLRRMNSVLITSEAREKLALQFAIKIATNLNIPFYETFFNPQYVDHFSRKTKSHSNFWYPYKRDF